LAAHSRPGLQRHTAAGAVRPQRLGSGPILGSFLFITTATVLASISLAKQTRGKGMAIAALVMAAIALLGTCGTRL